MTLSFVLLRFHWNLSYLIDSHPLVSLVLLVWILKYVFRWFFGINKIRRAQTQYTQLLEQHNDLLQRQTEMMEQHRTVLSKLGDKYL